MNNTQDKQFLALELTKIKFQNVTNVINKTQIYETYEYNLKRLCGLMKEIDMVSSLKSELEKVQEKNLKFESITRDSGEEITNEILEMLDECKGDMEPYVYERIVTKIMSYKGSQTI